jgi:hypothetical protein
MKGGLPAPSGKRGREANDSSLSQREAGRDLKLARLEPDHTEIFHNFHGIIP